MADSVKDLDALTRDDLVTLALTRGMDGAQFLTRAELVRALAPSHHDGILSVAKKLVQKAMSGWIGRSEPPAAPHETSTTTAEPIASAPSPTAMEETQTKPRTNPLLAALQTPLNADESDESPVVDEPVTLDATEGHEPIRTRTMARLLALQGHPERATQILNTLRLEHPTDERIQKEYDALSRGEPWPSHDEPKKRESIFPSRVTKKKARHVDRITATVVDHATVLASYWTSDEGVARARTVLQKDGALTLRVVLIATDSVDVVRSKLREIPCSSLEGEMLISDLPEEATAFVAIGLAADDRFVSIAHAPQLRMPRNMPVAEIATEYVALQPSLPASIVAERQATHENAHAHGESRAPEYATHEHATDAAPPSQNTLHERAPITSLDPAQPHASIVQHFFNPDARKHHTTSR